MKADTGRLTRTSKRARVRGGTPPSPSASRSGIPVLPHSATRAFHDDDLWTCPECGAKFVNRNSWHSCGRATLEDWKRRMGPQARRLYDRFEAMIAACGEYHVAPAKTRISFLGHVRFANINRLSEKGMVCDFALPKRIRSVRFTKVEEVIPNWWVHRLRVTDERQLDDKVQAWLRESYRLMGMRERLKR